MRCFLLSAAFLLALLAGRAAAQAVPPPPRSEAALVTAAPAVPHDTVAALHRLFAERRRRRTIIVAGSGVLTAGVAIGSGAGTSSKGIVSPAAVTVIFGLLGGAVIGGELAFFSKYSHKNEQRAVERFQAHRLDQNLRRKLKPRFFR